MAKEMELSLYPDKAPAAERLVVQSAEMQSSERKIFQGLSDRWQALKERSFGGYFEQRRQQKVRDYESAALDGERQIAQVRESMAKIDMAGSPAVAEAIERLEAEIARNRDQSDALLDKISDADGYNGDRNSIIARINGRIAEKQVAKEAELAALKKIKEELERAKKALDEKLAVFKALSEQFAQEISKQKTRKQKKGLESSWYSIAKEYQKMADISLDVERELESVKNKIKSGEEELKEITKNVEKRKVPVLSGAATSSAAPSAGVSPQIANEKAATEAQSAVVKRTQERTARKIMPRGSLAMQ
ncbi:MAG: hypothetical protein WAT81_01410 [Candidatus Moraniibacteriota bacterium]